MNNNQDKSLTFQSPIGKISIHCANQEVVEIILDSQDELVENQQPVLQLAKIELIEYFNSQRQSFTFPIIIKSSSFFTQVYHKMLSIKYGTTVSYQDLAIACNSPKAARAVGMANHINKLPIVVPCHRVIGKNKKMVGFASGIWVKEALLALEQGQEYHQVIDEQQSKIYSFGLAFPDGQYQQNDQSEKVELLLGSAELEIEGQVIPLKQFDQAVINSQQKHRVNWTSWDCVWLCSYF